MNTLKKYFMHFMKNVILSVICTLFTFTSFAQVFPGDADNNGVVNNLDILSIAHAFSAYGPSRSIDGEIDAQSINILWNDYFPNGLNYAFADSDGSGLIDYLDFVPVYSLYGMENPLGTIEQAFYTGIEGMDAPLFFDRSGMTPFLTEGSIVEIPLYLGDIATPVEDFSGIAFSINYDSDLIQDVNFTFEEDAWLNQEVETINFLSPENEEDKKEISIAPLENAVISGSGKIGTVSFIIIDNISSFLSSPTDSTNTLITISNVKMVNSGFYSVPVAAQNLDLMIYGPEALPTAINTTYLQKQIQIAPNPVHDELKIESQIQINKIDLMMMNGEIVFSRNYDQEKHIVLKTRAQYPVGMYFIRIYTEKGIINKKVLIE